MFANRPHRRGWRWRVAIVVAAVCLAGQAATVLHQVAVRHAFCAVHGDVVHLSPSPGETPPPWHALLPLVLASDGHEHCTVACLRRHLLAHAGNGHPLLVPVQLSSIALVARVPEPCGPPLIVLAPKSSPPARVGVRLPG